MLLIKKFTLTREIMVDGQPDKYLRGGSTYKLLPQVAPAIVLN